MAPAGDLLVRPVSPAPPEGAAIPEVPPAVGVPVVTVGLPVVLAAGLNAIVTAPETLHGVPGGHVGPALVVRALACRGTPRLGDPRVLQVVLLGVAVLVPALAIPAVPVGPVDTVDVDVLATRPPAGTQAEAAPSPPAFRAVEVVVLVTPPRALATVDVPVPVGGLLETTETPLAWPVPSRPRVEVRPVVRTPRAPPTPAAPATVAPVPVPVAGRPGVVGLGGATVRPRPSVRAARPRRH